MDAPLQTVEALGLSVLATLESVDVVVLVAQVATLLPQRWNIRPFVSTHWRLYQHDARGGELVLDDGVLALEPSRVYLIPPRLTFGTRCSAPCQQYFIHFELTGFPVIELHDLFPQPLALPESAAFESGLRKFSLEGGERDDGPKTKWLERQYRVKGIVFEALGRAIGSLPQERLDLYLNRLSALQPILPALEEIRIRVAEKLSNRELAALCFMSRDYFIRKFHLALGVSPAQYITDRRIALAARRLLFTTDSLEEIAESAGFRNRFYFTRVFTRETGVPPATYRRMPQA